MPTPHIEAQVGDIAKTVLMPGDPLRAKFFAEKYLKEYRQINGIRNCLGYTGKYKDQEVTIMASGMGMPSIGIYSYELYKFYGVENIIRIGSAGSYVKECKVYDAILASSAYSESSFAKCLAGYEEDIMQPSNELNEKLRQAAKELNIELKEGLIHSADCFYRMNKDYLKDVVNKGCIAVEMESFSLFANARALGKNAACLLTISDSFVSDDNTTSEERRTKFVDMVKIALEAAVK